MAPADLLQDVRFGMRSLRRQRGLTAAAIGTLALGIGALTTLASVVNAVLLEPLPHPESAALVQVWETRARIGRVRGYVSPADFVDWRARSRSFESTAAFLERSFNARREGAGEPLRVAGARVSGDFFTVLRAPAAEGRALGPFDDDPGAPQVAVLTDSLGRRFFGSAAAALGETVVVDGVPRKIVGVLPPSFPAPPSGSALFVPLALGPEEKDLRAVHYLQVLARLRPEVSVAAAREEMGAVPADLERQHQVNTGHGVSLFSLKEEVVGGVRPALRLLGAAVALILGIVCANVANLLLARAAGRSRELHLRVSLGAGRGRLVRQLLTEAVLLALAGGLLGIVLAIWSVDVLRGLPPSTLPRASEIRLDVTVLSFTLAASVATGLLFGLAPALQAFRLSPGTLAMGPRTLDPGGARLRRLLVVSQVAIALVLAAGAALLGRSLSLLLDVEPGFLRERLLTAELSLPEARYPTDASRDEFFRSLLERLRSTEGVLAAASVTAPPLRGPSGSRYFEIADAPPTAPGEGRNASFNLVSPDYFETMGIAILRGRDFTDADDREGAPVAIVSEAMASRFWPGQVPLGERIRVGEDPWRMVVGVVGNVRERALDEAPEPEMYWPQLQADYPLATLVVRTTREPLGLLPAIRSTVASIDRDLPLGRIATGEELVSATLAPRRFPLVLLAALAATALALAAVGLAGVLSYAVAVRTRELGLRLALGAKRRDVWRMILVEGLRLSGWGIAIGLLAALLAGRFLLHLLYGVRPADPATLVRVSVLLILVSLAACALPARRAMRIDPIQALHQD